MRYGFGEKPVEVDKVEVNYLKAGKVIELDRKDKV